VGFTLTEAQNIAAASGALEYDGSVLTVVGVVMTSSDWKGFYDLSENKIAFFSGGAANTDGVKVAMLVTFAAAKSLLPEDEIHISASGIKIYDGGAGLVTDTASAVAVTERPLPEIVIHNLPDFVFDSEINEYKPHFGAATNKIYISATPADISETVDYADTYFNDRFETSFSVVFNGGDGNISQYDFLCTKEAGAARPPDIGVYLNSNRYLASITVENGVLSPGFDKNITNYYVTAADIGALKIKAEAESVSAAVKISPFDALSSSVVITCTAEDGGSAVYTLALFKGTPVLDFPPSENQNSLWLWFGICCILAAGTGIFMVYLIK